MKKNKYEIRYSLTNLQNGSNMVVRGKSALRGVLTEEDYKKVPLTLNEKGIFGDWIVERFMYFYTEKEMENIERLKVLAEKSAKEFEEEFYSKWNVSPTDIVGVMSLLFKGGVKLG